MARKSALLLCFLSGLCFAQAQNTYKICFGEAGNEYCVDYPAGATATISVPGANDQCYHFDQWMDGNTDNPRQVQVTSDATYTATYSKNRLQVQTQVAVVGSGITSGDGIYTCGDNATIHATAAEHYHFLRWEKAGVMVSNSADYTFEVTGDHNDVLVYVAWFELDSVLLDVSSADVSQGSVAQEHSVYNPTRQNPSYYPWGVTGVVLTATPSDICYVFDRWSDGSRHNPYSLSAIEQSSLSLTAFFKERIDTITVVCDFDAMSDISVSDLSEAQVISKSASGASVVMRCGSSVALMPTLNDCYAFLGWDTNNDGIADATNLNLYVISDNQFIRLLCEKKKYHVIFASDNVSMGDAFGEGGVHNADVECGEYVQLQYAPQPCYEFDYWHYGSDAAVKHYDNRLGPITQDTILTCHFKQKEINITFSADNPSYGSVTGSYLGQTYSSAFPVMYCGDTFTLTPVANAGHRFKGWTDGVTDSVRTITIDGNTANHFTAIFSPLYTVTLQTDPQGAATGHTDKSEYEAGETATLSFTADDCYTFLRWEDGDTNPIKQIIVHGDTTLKALFSVNRYNLTIISVTPLGGWVSGSMGGPFECGTIVTAEAHPRPGYRFKCWQENGLADNPYSFTIVSDTILHAEFEPDVYTLTVSVDPQGSATVTGGGTYPSGTDVSVTITPADDCFEVVSWSDGSNAGNTRIVHLTSDSAVVATIARHNYVCTVIFDPQEVSAPVFVDMPCGQTSVVNAPDIYGWHFIGWFDGTTAGHTVSNAGNDTAFTARYERNMYLVTVDCDAERGSVSGGGTYAYEATAPLRADPAEGYQFVGWSDGYPDPVYDLVVTSDSTLTALFRAEPFTVYVIQDDVVCEDGEYTLPSGRVVSYSAVAMEYTDTTDFEYEQGVWCKRIFTITLYPASAVPQPVITTLPKAEAGKPLDVTDAQESALAGVYAAFSSQTSVLTDYYWELLNTATGMFERYGNNALPVVDSLTVRFVVRSQCAAVPSEAVTIPVSRQRRDDHGSCYSMVYINVENDTTLLSVDMERMLHVGYNFTDTDVVWYRVVDAVDSPDAEPQDDEKVATGAQLPLSKLALASGTYYARISLPEQEDIVVCNQTLLSAAVPYTAAEQSDFKLVPTLLRSGGVLTLLGLSASDEAQIRVYDAAGHMLFETKVGNSTFFDYTPVGAAGMYFMRVQTEDVKKTLKFILTD